MDLMGFDIRDIVMFFLILMVIYLIFKTRNIKEDFAEPPTTEDVVRQAVSDQYLVDISAMRNLGNIAQSMIKDEKLTLPANVYCPGDIVIDGNIKCTNKNTNLMNLFPKFMIVAWGDSNTVPKGWATCDGQLYIMDEKGVVSATLDKTNGIKTPDLRGRFVLGVNSASNKNADLVVNELLVTGGEETHTLTIGELPKHSHSHTFYNAGLNHHGHYTEGQILPNNSGTTNSPTNSTGEDQPHNNMPPYLALIYIMKL